MTTEPTIGQVNDDDRVPATKGDIREAIDELSQATNRSFERIDQRCEEIRPFIIEENEKTRHNFDVVVENIHRDAS